MGNTGAAFSAGGVTTTGAAIPSAVVPSPAATALVSSVAKTASGARVNISLPPVNISPPRVNISLPRVNISTPTPKPSPAPPCPGTHKKATNTTTTPSARILEHFPGRRIGLEEPVLPEEPSSCLDTLKLEAVDVTDDPLELLPEDSKSLSALLAAALQQQAEQQWPSEVTTTTANGVVTFRRSSTDVAAICNSLAEEAPFRDVIIYPGEGKTGRPSPVHCCSILLAALSPALRNVLASAERNAAGQFELIAADLGAESWAELVSLMARVSTLLALPGSGGNVMLMGRELWQFLGHGQSQREVIAGDTGTERQADVISWGAGVLDTSVTTALEGRRVGGNTGTKRPGPASGSFAKRWKTAAPEPVAAAAPALSITAVRAPPAVCASALAAAAAPVLAATPVAPTRVAAAVPALSATPAAPALASAAALARAAAAAPARSTAAAPESAGLADRTTAGIRDLQGRGITGPDKPNGVVMLAGDRFGSVISALGGRELGGDLIARDLSGGREDASTRFFR